MSRRASRAASSLSRLAFTLIEVLVAVAIVAGMGLLVLPGLMNWSSSASDSAVVDQVQSAVDSARAIAIDAGVPVTLTVKAGESADVITARWGASRRKAQAASPPSEEGADRDATPSPGEREDGQVRLLLRLPDQFRIRIPASGEEWGLDRPVGAERAGGWTDESAESASGPSWLILPDGTVDSAVVAELIAPDGRRGGLRISALAGVVRCDALVAAQPEESPGAETTEADQNKSRQDGPATGAPAPFSAEAP